MILQPSKGCLVNMKLLFTIILLAIAIPSYAGSIYNPSATGGSGVTDITCNADEFIDSIIAGIATCGAPPDSGIPIATTVITQTPCALCTNEQALSLLGTGLMFNTTTTGVVSIYAGSAC